MHARSFRSTLSWICLAALVAGCSAPPTSLPPVPGSAPSAGSHPRRGRTTATLRLKIPKRRRHKGHYISPATQSASIAIAPAAGCTRCTPAKTLELALTPASAGCTTGATAIVCTQSFVLTPGSYIGAMSTYDGPLLNHAPSGNLLSTNQHFPLTIAAGNANMVSVTLSGVPRGVTFGLISAPKGSYLDTPVTGLTLHVTGAGQTARLSVYAVDADGYTITGPGSPGATVQTEDGRFTAHAISGSNVVTVTSPAHYTQGALSGFDALYVTLTGPGCSQSSASCSGFLELRPEQLLAVFSQNYGSVTVMTDDFTEVADIAGLTAPSAAAFDSEGDLFISDSALGHVYEYAFPYEHLTATIASNVASSYSNGIAIDPNDDQLAVMTSSGISLYNPPYSTAAASYALAAPEAVAYDLVGDLFATSADEKLRKFVPPLFDSTPYSVSVGQTALWYLYLDDSSQVDNPSLLEAYVGSRTGHAVYEYDISLNAVGSPMTMPATIDGVVENQSEVYISEVSGNVISNFGLFNYSTGLDGPSSLKIDLNSHLVVLQTGNGSVSHYASSSNYLIDQFNTGMGSPTNMTLWPN